MIKNFTKTKILATLGPATDTKEKILAMIDAGIDGVRLNFSHGSYDYFEKIFSLINDACVQKEYPLTVLIDLQGPKIRVGELSEEEIELIDGDIINIVTENILGTKEVISTSYKALPQDASIGDNILIDDGLIKLKVSKISKDTLECRIIEGGILKPRKGMNLPGMKLSTPSVTDKDFNDLEFALKHRVDIIALSFVRKAGDITGLRNWMNEKGFSNPIIAKIEKPEGVDNFDSILKEADGIMVARGDLGVEMDPQDVPVIQKNIIRKCREKGKLVITATQMLESMIHNPVPTRAEASDVANAVWDGSDVVMLSGETSVGRHPVEAVKIMNDIILKSETQHHFNINVEYKAPVNLVDNMFDAAGRAAVEAAKQVNAKLIIVFSHHGRKAKTISKFRPDAPVVVFSDQFETLNVLSLYYGTIPYYVEDFDIEETAVEKATEILYKHSVIEKGEIILFTSGAPYNEIDRRSWNRFVVVE